MQLRAVEIDNLEEGFQSMNARRIDLARKQDSGGLTPAEQEELTALQASIRAYTNARFPLPFADLEQLERLAEKISPSSNEK